MKKSSVIFLIIIVTLVLNACTSYDYDQPDTAANQAGFERHFGFPPPASVTELYYFANETGADVSYQLGFNANQETVRKIVTELNLIQQDADSHISFAQEFDWWDVEVIDTLTPYWKSNPSKDYFWFLWYDSNNQTAYYLEFSL